VVRRTEKHYFEDEWVGLGFGTGNEEQDAQGEGVEAVED
jgi:hypothetical protein